MDHVPEVRAAGGKTYTWTYRRGGTMSAVCTACPQCCVMRSYCGTLFLTEDEWFAKCVALIKDHDCSGPYLCGHHNENVPR